jgi:hypothetical protein
MKINLNGLPYNRVCKEHSYCGGCHLLTPCGLHLARCEIDRFYKNLCSRPNYIFEHCNTSIFAI